MSAIDTLDALTRDEEQEIKASVLLDGIEYIVPVLKAKHLAKAIKMLIPYQEEIKKGNLDIIYKDMDSLISMVGLFFDKDSEWAGNLTTQELYEAFNAVYQKNPDFFVDVVLHLVPRQ